MSRQALNQRDCILTPKVSDICIKNSAICAVPVHDPAAENLEKCCRIFPTSFTISSMRSTEKDSSRLLPMQKYKLYYTTMKCDGKTCNLVYCFGGILRNHRIVESPFSADDQTVNLYGMGLKVFDENFSSTGTVPAVPKQCFTGAPW
jgi:hypothetical protein